MARTLLAQWLDGRLDAAIRADAALLVSELVTNSVRHADQPAGSPVHIRAALNDGVVHVEVEDGGNGTVRSRAPGRDGFGSNGFELDVEPEPIGVRPGGEIDLAGRWELQIVEGLAAVRRTFDVAGLRDDLALRPHRHARSVIAVGQRWRGHRRSA